MSDKPTIQFEIYDGDRLLRTEVLAESTIKIGKLSSSHLRIDDDDVSRMHAVIEAGSADDVVVLDLGSTSGTFVNGQRVTKQRLRSGDELQLGRHRVVVTVSGQSSAAARPSANAMATTQVRPDEMGAPRRAVVLEEDESDSDTVAATPLPSAAPPTAAATAPAAPSGPAVRLVTLRITSDPPGAQVLERGTPLGRTPLVVRRPAAQRVLALQLKREGYGDKQVTLNLANDAQAHARLEALFELVP